MFTLKEYAGYRTGWIIKNGLYAWHVQNQPIQSFDRYINETTYTITGGRVVSINLRLNPFPLISDRYATYFKLTGDQT